jgi:hypothetical protein
MRMIVGGRYIEGEERIVVGKPLILRESAELDSAECGKVGNGARVRVAQVQPTEEGLRVKVLVLAHSHGGSHADPPEVKTYGWLTAMKNGKERLVKAHFKVDIDERRQQGELWSRRLAADKAYASQLHHARDSQEKVREGDRARGDHLISRSISSLVPSHLSSHLISRPISSLIPSHLISRPISSLIPPSHLSSHLISSLIPSHRTGARAAPWHGGLTRGGRRRSCGARRGRGAELRVGAG